MAILFEYNDGAKLYGIKEGIQDYIEDMKMTEHFADYFKSGNWLGEQIWGSMDITLKREMAFMEWVQTCAGIMASANKPLVWNSPIGMKCVQSPFVTKCKYIDVKINGTRYQYKLQTPTTTINRSKMISSSSPNVIHSCDGAHLGMTVNKCEGDGITDFAMVHDSFGTHPDDTKQLLQNAKSTWVDIYSKNWMQIWYESWCNQLGYNDLPKPSEFVTLGTLNAKDVIKSDFFFS